MKQKQIHKIQHENVVDGGEGERDHTKFQGDEVGGVLPVAFDVDDGIYEHWWGGMEDLHFTSSHITPCRLVNCCVFFVSKICFHAKAAKKAQLFRLDNFSISQNS